MKHDAENTFRNYIGRVLAYEGDAAYVYDQGEWYSRKDVINMAMREESRYRLNPFSNIPRLLQIGAVISSLYKGHSFHLSKIYPMYGSSILASAQGLLQRSDLVILDTSGTTNQPKHVVLTFNSLLTNLLNILSAGVFLPESRMLSLLPLNHAFGLMGDLLVPFFNRQSVVLCYSAAEYAKYLVRGAANATNLPPALCELVLTTVRIAKSNSLERVICGGAAIGADEARLFNDIDIGFHEAYGMTECAPCVSINQDGFRHHGDVGMPLIKNSVKIDVTGEIMVNSPCVMLGYVDGGRLDTSRIEPSGWFHTHDAGFLDNDGFLHITGRLDGVVCLSNGKKLMPEIIEGDINATCKVADCAIRFDESACDLTLLVAADNHALAIEKKIQHCLNAYDIGPVKIKWVKLEELYSDPILKKKVRKI